MSSQRRSITDSPWYWVQLFCTAGLVALMLMGPKYAARQTQIERNHQARQRAAVLVAGQDAGTPPATSDRPEISLWPLYAALMAVLVVSWWKLFRWRRLGRHVEVVEAG